VKFISDKYLIRKMPKIKNDEKILQQSEAKETKEEQKKEPTIAVPEAEKRYTKAQIRRKLTYAKKTNLKKYERLMRKYRDYHPSDDEEEEEEEDKTTFLLTDDEYDKIKKALSADFKEKQIETLQKLFDNESLLANVINFFKDRAQLKDE
jgi:hypothetical protein